jgi:integrase
LAELRVDREKGTSPTTKNVRLGIYCQKFLEGLKVSGIREDSLREYHYRLSIIQGYFKPDSQLRHISVGAFRDFERELPTLGKREGKELAPGTQAGVLMTLRRILSEAREEGYRCIDPPKKRKSNTRNGSKRVKHLEPRELDLLLKHSAEYGLLFHDLFLLLAYSGMRISEALALTWDDIDWVNQEIHISKRLYRSKINIPKTEASERRVEAYEPVIRILERRKRLITELHIRHPEWRELNLVFPNASGDYPSYGHVSHIFKRSLGKAGLSQDYSLHDLRHTCASWLLGQTHDLAYVAEQLGHANSGITLKFYHHLLQSNKKQITHRINAGFSTNLQQNDYIVTEMLDENEAFKSENR